SLSGVREQEARGQARGQDAVVESLVGRERCGDLGLLLRKPEDLPARGAGPQEELEHEKPQVLEGRGGGEAVSERFHDGSPFSQSPRAPIESPIHAGLRSGRPGTGCSSSWRLKLVSTAAQGMPARRPASSPVGESSTTRQSAGSAPAD